MGTTIRVLLIEDHGIVREGIRLILDSTPDIEVIADAATGSEGVSLFQRYRYQPGIDVIVTDYSLPDFDGLSVVHQIKAFDATARVLFLSMYHDTESIRALLDSGANGYLLKQAAVRELPEAVRAVAYGETYLSPLIAKQMLGHLRRAEERNQQLKRLTEREQAVLNLLATGATSKEIGQRLNLTTKTVENYRSRILSKLNVTNTVAAVVFAGQQESLRESLP